MLCLLLSFFSHSFRPHSDGIQYIKMVMYNKRQANKTRSFTKYFRFKVNFHLNTRQFPAEVFFSLLLFYFFLGWLLMSIYRVLKGRKRKKNNKIPPPHNREKTQSVSKLFACACVHFMRCRVDSRFSLVPFQKKTWGFSDGGFSDAYTHTHTILCTICVFYPLCLILITSICLSVEGKRFIQHWRKNRQKKECICECLCVST